MIGIHFNGRPVSSDVADRVCDALLEAWSPSEMGAQAIVDVLSGDCNPSGKLPVCVAYNAGQLPVYYNHPSGSCWSQGESIGFTDYVDAPHRPRYVFGHGLSYTTFDYRNVKIEQKQVGEENEIHISFELANIGNVSGTEVAQLYVKDCYASMTRPVKELAGFKRVMLQPGEQKKVTFRMRESQLAFLDRKMQWKVEKGSYVVEIGSSSEDIRLNGEFRIQENTYVEGRSRGFYAEAVVE